MLNNQNNLKRIGKQRLGETAERIQLHTLEACSYTARILAEQAHRSLDLFTYDLEASIFDQQPFLDAVRSLALSSNHSRIRILLADNEQVQKQGHRLIDIARRLTSSFEIRHTHNDWRDRSETLLIVDKTGLARWNHHTMKPGEVSFNDKPAAVKSFEFFTTVWEASEPDSELRRLYL